MIYDMILVFFALIGVLVSVMVLVFVAMKLSDAWQSYWWARKQERKAVESSKLPEVAVIHLSLGSRLEARSVEAQAIESARQANREKLDREIREDMERLKSLWSEIDRITQ